MIRKLGDTLKRCGIPEPTRWGTVGKGRRAPTPECAHPAGHGGPCTWEICGEGEPTIDTYPDDAIECQRERGHEGKHRWAIEWSDE